jgi:hypothetical protein
MSRLSLGKNSFYPKESTMHDPFQTYANQPYTNQPYTNQPYTNMAAPYGAPYYGASINPLAALGLSQGNPTTINPITGVPQTGQQGYGLHPAQNFINPQQLQLALASQAAIPQLFGISPLAAGLQNPMVAALLSNPLIAAGIQSQFGQQPQFGQFGGSPFGQGGPVAGNGYPLAPQSWVGQAGQLGGQAYGQIHPLVAAHLTARALQGQAFSPWGY